MMAFARVILPPVVWRSEDTIVKPVESLQDPSSHGFPFGGPWNAWIVRVVVVVTPGQAMRPFLARRLIHLVKVVGDARILRAQNAINEFSRFDAGHPPGIDPLLLQVDIPQFLDRLAVGPM